jgi:demethylmenaquinone methyltransferase/2-methoxy-6-polyprenyl-1,4-benzoquinol methylase
VSKPGRDVAAVLNDPDERRRFVGEVFDTIAPRYDRFTRFFSFGMDAGWKRCIADWAGRSRLPDGAVVDLACGTGDLLELVAQRISSPESIGVDASLRMLGLARQRAALLVAADIGALPFRSDHLALATAGYAFRNVGDFRAALRALAGQMADGGVLITLDFYLPRSPVWRALFLWWLGFAGGAVGWWWHRSPEVYGYIAHSIRRFVSADEFARELVDAGFVVTRQKRWLFGGIAAHMARRAGTTRSDLPSASV